VGSTRTLLDEVAKAVNSGATAMSASTAGVSPAADGESPEELKDASRRNRALREHDQLAAHDAPAPPKLRTPRKKKA
jgi:hypothetical protein